TSRTRISTRSSRTFARCLRRRRRRPRITERPRARIEGRGAAASRPFLFGEPRLVAARTSGPGHRRVICAFGRRRGISPMRLAPLATALGTALTVAALAATPAGAQSTESDTGMSTAQPDSPAAAADNPLFAPSPLPLRYPRFDLIEDAHFAPALERGMAEHLEEIDAIAKNPEPPTVENTIVAHERSGELLE